MIVETLDPKEGELIYDPACSTSGLRTFFGKIYGQEKNLTTSSVARMNLVLRGIENFQLAREDTLGNPAFNDAAIKKMHFEPRLVHLLVDQDQIDEALRKFTAGFRDEERDQLGKQAAKIAVLLKAPDRIQAVCAAVAQHYQEKFAPNGFGAQVVIFDCESCDLYKQTLDQNLPREVSNIVISVTSG